jgi:hypothetical protein
VIPRLCFLAALGLLKVITDQDPGVRLAFLDDGTFRPLLAGKDATRELGQEAGPGGSDRWKESEGLVDLVVRDAAVSSRQSPWFLTYETLEKRGAKKVADLKAPPVDFADFLRRCLQHWVSGDDVPAGYAAAFGTSEARDGKGNTKPTAFHFTAAHQQFLGTIDLVRQCVDAEWTTQSLFEGHAARPGPNVRWDPAAERNYAPDPQREKTQVDAPLEWLAFRGMVLFPTFPQGKRVITSGVSGRGESMTFHWPLWSVPASQSMVRSLVSLSWREGEADRAARGVFAVCSSGIRRTAQGFGNFSPSVLAP